jgi:hypothetical protein
MWEALVKVVEQVVVQREVVHVGGRVVVQVVERNAEMLGRWREAIGGGCMRDPPSLWRWPCSCTPCSGNARYTKPRPNFDVFQPRRTQPSRVRTQPNPAQPRQNPSSTTSEPQPSPAQACHNPAQTVGRCCVHTTSVRLRRRLVGVRPAALRRCDVASLRRCVVASLRRSKAPRASPVKLHHTNKRRQKLNGNQDCGNQGHCGNQGQTLTATPAWKHSQYRFRHFDRVHRHPFPWPPDSSVSVGAILARNAFALRSNVAITACGGRKLAMGGRAVGGQRQKDSNVHLKPVVSAL